MKTQFWSKNSNNTIAGTKPAMATIIVSMNSISPRHDSGKRAKGDTDNS